MNPNEFERILSIGLGRAILHLQSNDARPYRNAILYACLYNVSYDWQIEGDRAKYMLDVIALTGEADFYRDEILAALRHDSENADVSQLIHFAALFAARGDAEARQLLYEYCARTLRTDQNRDAARRIVELNGIDGLLLVLRELEKHRIPPEDLDDYTLLFSILEERDGEEQARSSLEQMTSQDFWIASYLRAINDFRQTVPRDRARIIEGHGRIYPDEATYEQLRAILHDSTLMTHPNVLPRSFWYRWGSKASDADIDRATQDFSRETDRDRLLRYLYMFERRRFLREPSRLLELAVSTDERVSEAALQALQHVEDPRVRRLALSLLDSESGLRLSWSISLLRSNYQAGDHLLIERALRNNRDDEDFHSIGFAAWEVFEAHLTQDAVAALLFIYEWGPCALCREDVVKLLHQLGSLPAEIAAECRWDSNFGLREMARAW